MPYKDKNKRAIYQKNWHRKNKDKVRIDSAKYYQKNRQLILLKKKEYCKKNKEKRCLYDKRIKLKFPWRSSYFNAKNRCTNKNNQDYKTYGKRGIKFLLTIEEIKKIWFRDKAFLLHRATIDRKNNNKNYCFTNCRFIEGSENATKGNYESRWLKIKKGLQR